MNENPKSFEEILEEKGYLVYTTIGNSMRPFLRQNRDIVIIEASQGCRCKKHDVVLYKRNNKYILHRILKVLPDGYIIAGDHNTVLERDITDEKILGTLVQIIRDGKVIHLTDKKYKVYVHLWCDFYPIRVVVLRGRNLFFKCLKCIR